MRSDHLALRGRHGGEGAAGLAVERCQFLLQAGGVGGVGGAVGRVGSRQRLRDVRHVLATIGDILPGMRVDIVAVPVALAALLVRFADRLHALAGDGELAAIAGRLDQAVDPALEAETVDDHQTGARQRSRVARRRLIDVRVGARTDQRVHLDEVAADLLRQVAEDAEAGDDRQSLASAGAAGKAAAEARQSAGRRQNRPSECSSAGSRLIPCSPCVFNVRNASSTANGWPAARAGRVPATAGTSAPSVRTIAGPAGRSAWYDSSRPASDPAKAVPHGQQQQRADVAYPEAAGCRRQDHDADRHQGAERMEAGDQVEHQQDHEAVVGERRTGG
jgi:hypothetical protein